MSKAIITESHLTDIANAIIAKGGSDAPLKPSEMAAAIAAIPSGGAVVPLSVTANGVYQNVNGYSPVTVNVGGWDGDDIVIVYDLVKFPDAPAVLPFGGFSTGNLGGTLDFGDESQPVTFGSYSTFPTHSYTQRKIYEIRITPNRTVYYYNGVRLWDHVGITEVYLSKITELGPIAPFNSYTKVHFPASGMRVDWRCVCSGTGAITDTEAYFITDEMPRMSTNDVIRSGLKVVHILTTLTGVQTNGKYRQPSEGFELICFDGNSELSVGNYVLSRYYDVIEFRGLSKINIPESGVSLFEDDKKLMYMPEIDASYATSLSNAFQGCTSLRMLPKLKANVNVSFASCVGVVDKQSVLDFAANINTCVNVGQSITFNSVIKTLLGDDFAVVESTLTAKNWSVAW